MNDEREFYVHTFTVKVLTDCMFFQSFDLQELHRETMYGASVLHSMESVCESVTEDDMAELLVEAGADPEFLGIEEDSEAIFTSGLFGHTYRLWRPEDDES